MKCDHREPNAASFLAAGLAWLWIGPMCLAQSNEVSDQQTASNEQVDLQSTFEQTGRAGKPAFPFRRGGVWGFLDRDGRVAIPPQYRHATGVQDGLALVWSDEGVCVINATGKIVTRLPDSYYAWWAADDRIWLQDKKSRLYSLFDGNGTQIVPPTFQEVRSFHHGFAVVASGGDWEFPGLLENATHSYVDVHGQNAFGKTFDDIAWSFHDGRAVVGDVVINTKGETVFEAPDGCDFEFSQGWIAVDHYGPPRATAYLDVEGNVALRVPFRSESFSEGLAPFALEVPSKNGGEDAEPVVRWGYIDRTGKQVIPPTFTSAQPFQDGLAAVGVKSLDSKNVASHDQELIGFIEQSGKVVIPPKYNDTTGFSNDRCLVHQGGYQPVVDDGHTWWEEGRWLLVDKSGNELAVTEVDRKR